MKFINRWTIGEISANTCVITRHGTFIFTKISIIQKQKSCKSWRHFCTVRAIWNIHRVFPPSVPLETFVDETSRIRQNAEKRWRRKRASLDLFDVWYSAWTTNDGFECYSRGGFAKFDHGSLERGMREAILCGKVSRQMSTLREVRVSPFILTFIFHRSDTFDPRWEIPPSSFQLSFNFVSHFFHVCVKIEEKKKRVLSVYFYRYVYI